MEDDSFPVSWMDHRHDWDIKYTVNVDREHQRFTLMIDNMPFEKLPRAGHRESKPEFYILDSDDEDEKMTDEVIEQRKNEKVQAGKDQ